jgi:hypothetical protein
MTTKAGRTTEINMTGKLKGMIQLATAFALVMPTIALADESENIMYWR